MTVPANTNALLLRSAAPAAYQISRSLRFNSADSAYLSRTPGSAGNQKTYTLSMWIKRSNLGQKYFFGSYYSNLSRYQYLGFNSSDQLEFFGGVYTTGGSTTTHVNLSTTAVYRDVSAWYHLVLAVDTTQATSTNRVKLYVNGTQVTDFGTVTYPAQNSESYINSVQAHYLGDWGGGGSISLDGYLADIYFLDGTATTPSTFAETDAITGQWVPKTPTSISYGTNGFRLTFSDNSGTTSTTLGKDAAGSNNWTPNNFSVASGSGNDSLVDSPTSYGTDARNGGEVRGNYATLNPLQAGSSITFSNGNLDIAKSGTSDKCTASTIGMTTGKWYFEVTITNLGGGEYAIGFGKNIPIESYLGSNATTWAYADTGSLMNNAGVTSYGSSYTTGDVLGAAFDGDNGTLVFYKNGVSQGTAATGLTQGPYFFAVGVYNSAATRSANFGARAFSYQAPSGFKALCDTNLTAPTIAKPADQFGILLWTGNTTNGNGSRAISGLNFQPEFVWIKARSASVYGHLLFDAVRGAANSLASESTALEGAPAANGKLDSFDSTGFTVNNGTSNGWYVNTNGENYVGWCWNAASSNTTDTTGSITSTRRTNATSGCSIVTYTGTGSAATVGHGLGAAPAMIISKNRDFSGGTNWQVYHTSLGNTKSINLNTTGTPNTDVGWWNNTSPTSTVYSIGSYNSSNGDKFVAYCFAPVAGYSAFGSYTGNGSSDGPFVFTGFRPRWIMIKPNVSDTYSYWLIDDTARSPYNVAQAKLAANLSDQENSSNIGTQPYDILSNGFKLRTGTGIGLNQNGTQYLYACFAESPFQYARAR